MTLIQAELAWATSEASAEWTLQTCWECSWAEAWVVWGEWEAVVEEDNADRLAVSPAAVSLVDSQVKARGSRLGLVESSK